jgi:hypothetical protein
MFCAVCLRPRPPPPTPTTRPHVARCALVCVPHSTLLRVLPPPVRWACVPECRFAEAGSAVDVQAKDWAVNPYAWADASSPVTTPVFSISVSRVEGGEVPVESQV